MKTSQWLLLLPALTSLAAAQVNLLSIIVSEANSVATQVNSILSSAASAVSAAASSVTQTSASDSSTTSDSSASSASDASTLSTGAGSSLFSSISVESTSSSQASPASSPTSAAFGALSSSASSSSRTSGFSTRSSSAAASSKSTSSPTLSSPIVGTSSVLGASAVTSTSAPESSSDPTHHSHLAIILGCVLGALALGFFILALVLCCRRRRRHGLSPRHSALSLHDDEVDSWRGDHGAAVVAGGARHARGTSGVAPLMSEHPAYRNGEAHENPFVPVPPPTRRSAPNSRPGLTDGMVPGENPFLDRHSHDRSVPSNGNGGSHHGIAAGIAAAAAGGALMHEHNKHKHVDDDATLVNDKPISESGPRRQLSRKPVPVNHSNNSDPWPYDPVSTVEPIGETAALTKASSRPSTESRRSYNRDATRANAAFDQQYTPEHGERNHHHGLGAGVAGVAAGAIGGAALAHHHDRDRRRSRSSSSSGSGNRRSRPPLAVSGEDSDHSSTSRNSRESRGSRIYSDAVAAQPTYDYAPAHQSHSADLYGVPVAPATRSRTNSGHGIALPSAAAFAQANRPNNPSPLSAEVRHDHSPQQNKSRRSSSQPRYSFPDESLSRAYSPYPAFPSSSANQGYSAVPPSEAFPPLPVHQAVTTNPDKAIVGDNGYPHMGLPRRKSGGEYDLPTTGPLGPQIVSPHEGPASRHTTMQSSAVADDSTWRMSDGMPGGWQRASADTASPRNSRDLANRDSSVGTGRRRLRASDFGGAETQGTGYGQAL